jgi:myo-inositol 2-dehydrogenase/D-chiro-inositol 1-dehydrogenase
VVCDVDGVRARHLAEALGASDVASDPLTVIARADVDAVIVASPDFTHAPLSLACIQAGKRVLCEKPLSQASAACWEVMQAEQSAGERFIQLGFMRRYDQAYVEMKAALDQGQLGRALIMNNFHRNVATPAADFTAAMAITNSAPHEFDVVRHVLGTEYVSISAFQPRRSDALVAPVCMVLETADGQLVTIEINNNAAYGYDVRAELVGEAGSIAMNHVAFTRTDAALATRTACVAAMPRPIVGRTGHSCALCKRAYIPKWPRPLGMATPQPSWPRPEFKRCIKATSLMWL